MGSWVLITPISEKGCYSEEEYKEKDDAAYKLLNVIGDFAEKYLNVEKRFKEDANPEEIRSYLANSKANVLAMGHGYDTLITANNCKIWLREEEIPEWVKGRAFVFVACLTGKSLGKKLVEKGAKFYAGLREVGVLVGLKNPGYCRYHYCQMIGLIEAAVSYDLGHSIDKIAERVEKRWENEIDYWANFYDEEKIVSADGVESQVTAEMAQALMTVLMWNKNATVIYPVTALAPRGRDVVVAVMAGLTTIGLSLFLGRYIAPAIARRHPMPSL